MGSIWAWGTTEFFFLEKFSCLDSLITHTQASEKTKLKFSCQVHFNIFFLSWKVDLIKFLSCRENAKKGLPLESGTVKIQNNNVQEEVD